MKKVKLQSGDESRVGKPIHLLARSFYSTQTARMSPFQFGANRFAS